MPTTKKPKLTISPKYWPVGVAILLGVLLLISKFTQQKLTLMPPPTPNSTTEIANWNTYDNQKYKFQIKYPPNMTVKENVDRQFYLDLTLGEEKYRLAIESSEKPSFASRLKPDKTENINNIRWIIYPESTYCDAGCGTTPITYETEKGTERFSFLLYKTNSELPLFNQILSTLQFLDGIVLEQILLLTDQTITWKEKIYINNYSGQYKGWYIEGTTSFTNTVDFFFDGEQLKSLGWEDDITLAAGGMGGQVYGYKRLLGDKQQILEFSFQQTDFLNKTASTRYTVFLSDLF